MCCPFTCGFQWKCKHSPLLVPRANKKAKLICFPQISLVFSDGTRKCSLECWPHRTWLTTPLFPNMLSQNNGFIKKVWQNFLDNLSFVSQNRCLSPSYFPQFICTRLPISGILRTFFTQMLHVFRRLQIRRLRSCPLHHLLQELWILQHGTRPQMVFLKRLPLPIGLKQRLL